MKKITAVLATIGFILILAGCNGAYKSHIEAGEEAIHEKDYPAALGHYADAVEEKETDEAIHVHGTLETVIAGLEAYDQEDYEQSITHFKEVMEADEEKAEITAIIKEDMETYLNNAELASETYESMLDLVELGRGNLDAGDHEAAISNFEQAVAMGQEIESEKIKELAIEAESLLEQAETARSGAAQPADEETSGEDAATSEGTPEEDKPEEDLEAGTDLDVEPEERGSASPEGEETGVISVDKAEQYVWDYLRDNHEAAVSAELNINFDHENEQGHYVFQVYEIAGGGGDTRTSTLGWFAVNPENGQVYDAMN